jgi:hypothetical protein
MIEVNRTIPVRYCVTCGEMLDVLYKSVYMGERADVWFEVSFQCSNRKWYQINHRAEGGLS